MDILIPLRLELAGPLRPTDDRLAVDPGVRDVSS
jgi:hypothetical protein